MVAIYIVLLLALNGGLAGGLKLQIVWSGRVSAGSSTTFTCSSNCLRNCTYSWSLLGRTFNGSTLTWTPDGLHQSVALQCTGRKNIGHSSTTTVIMDIENPVSVQVSPAGAVPSLNLSVDLLCHVDGATPSTVVWYKDGQKMVWLDHMHLLHNATLHFDSLQPSDVGFYTCGAVLNKSWVFSLGYLLSGDTAWNVSISGPDKVFVGRLHTFTCLMTCTLNVDCTVRWPFEGGFPLGSYISVHEDQLLWIPIVPGTFQNLTCLVENVAAGRSAKATKMLEVIGAPLSGSLQLTGLSTLVLGLALLSVTY
ncbi:carcinoembryonic antigen-related cell adhesion molecule 20-like isoform X2 [Hippocampus zosterae]|uniref:carcinoembryonic antigen-related cell adhesion molecule 20-like isoform X2 n=1 Tax=Hippocampus zosterae TaxID=109293 RepID=UPI00223CA07F|nr:carcinoembryonic antigen-related cell adhesion molecule 20-like isoform X2 [Hippocampus zosterae]